MTPDEKKDFDKLKGDFAELKDLFFNHKHREYDKSKLLGSPILDGITVNKANTLFKLALAGTMQTVLTDSNIGLFTPTANRFSQYAQGTGYSLTTSYAKLTFSSVDPTITIGVAGTYMLFARVNLKYSGATFSANRNVNFKIRKTNGTPSDVGFSETGFVTQLTTTVTATAGIIPLPVTLFTASANDVLQLWGIIDVLPSAGSIDAVAAEIIAIRVV